MKLTKIYITVVALVAMAAVTARSTAGEPIGTGFTYQGQLLQGGLKYDGLADMTFRLYDDATAGAQIGSDLVAAGVDVDFGQFTVDLDFGIGTFAGEKRWLEIEVNSVLLDPRQPLMPVPYAMYAASSPTDGTSGGASWTFRGTNITTMDNVGIGTTNPGYPLHLVSDSTWGMRSYATGTGVYGRHTSTTGTFPGVWGETDSLSSGAAGVRAIVVSETPGTNSAGVLAINNSTTANGVGIKAQHNGSGHGVHATSNGGFGGYFEGKGYFQNSLGVGTSTPESLMHLAALGGIDFIIEADTNNAGGEDQNARILLRQDGSVVTARMGFGSNNDLQIMQEYNDDLVFGTANLSRMRIKNDGDIGIGTEAPAARVHIASPGVANLLLESGDGDPAVHFQQNDVTGRVGLSGSNMEVMQELGAPLILGTDDSERMRITGTGFVGIGTNDPTARLHVINIGPDPALRVSGVASVTLLEITGADLAEKFPASEATTPGTVMAIDPEHPGELCIARGAYTRRVAGVVSGANDFAAGAILGNLPGTEDAPPIALSGRVWVKCDATTGPIRVGDLLTTSNTPGHAMAVTDHDRAPGAVIGKAMTSLDSDMGMVLVLVSLQ